MFPGCINSTLIKIYYLVLIEATNTDPRNKKKRKHISNASGIFWEMARISLEGYRCFMENNGGI